MYFKELGCEGTDRIHLVYYRYQLKYIVDIPDSVASCKFLDKTESRTTLACRLRMGDSNTFTCVQLV